MVMLRKVGRALLTVVHDPQVERAARQAAVLAAARLALALGCSVEVASLIGKLA